MKGWQSRLFAAGVVALLTGCNGATGPPSFENVAGNFRGSFASQIPGFTLDAELVFVIQQAQGELSGSVSVTEGTVVDPSGRSFPLTGEITFTGTIAAGSNPALTLVIEPGEGCPVNRVPPWPSWTGSYLSRDDRISLSVILEIAAVKVPELGEPPPDPNCDQFIVFQDLVTLSR